MTYAIEFRFPDGLLYAGMYKGAFGWAPTLATALLYEDAEVAQRVLKNAYGKNAQNFGYVVPVKVGNA